MTSRFTNGQFRNGEFYARAFITIYLSPREIEIEGKGTTPESASEDLKYLLGRLAELAEDAVSDVRYPDRQAK